MEKRKHNRKRNSKLQKQKTKESIISIRINYSLLSFFLSGACGTIIDDLELTRIFSSLSDCFCFVFRLYWDLMILSMLIVNMFVLPVAIAFFNDDMSPSWIAFNSISDGVFLLDIVLNFKTGVLVHGTPNKFILDPKKIAIR